MSIGEIVVGGVVRPVHSRTRAIWRAMAWGALGVVAWLCKILSGAGATTREAQLRMSLADSRAREASLAETLESTASELKIAKQEIVLMGLVHERSLARERAEIAIHAKTEAHGERK